MTTKKAFFVLAVLLAASCARQHLNYQSSHNNAGDYDNTPAPVTQTTTANTGGGQNNYNNVNNYDQQQQVDYSSPTYQTFYDDLSPYGYWVEYPNYGYVWVPNAEPGFSPYGTNGNWVYTSYGWTWNSGYNWGWAPFHYGRWFYDNSYGWMWVPGNQWAPAWVTWGGYGEYYGWAPCEPGVTITEGYSPPMLYWRFVPVQYICSENVYSYAINNREINSSRVYVISNSANYEKHMYFTGPPRAEVERYAGAIVQTVNIHESEKPVRTATVTNNNLDVYRPVIRQNTGAVTKAAPGKVTSLSTLKPVNNAGNNAPGNSNNTNTSHQNNTGHVNPQQPVEQHNNVNEHQTQPATPVQQHNNLDGRQTERHPPVEQPNNLNEHQAEQQIPAQQHNNLNRPQTEQHPPVQQHNNLNEHPAEQQPPAQQHNNLNEHQAEQRPPVQEHNNIDQNQQQHGNLNQQPRPQPQQQQKPKPKNNSPSLQMKPQNEKH